MASAVFYCGSEEFSGCSHQQIGGDQEHFLEACFMCEKPLGLNRDIFMYRGNTAFCSHECRQEQIERDEAKERRRNLSGSVRALRKTAPSPSGSTAAGSDARSTVAGAVSVA